MGLDLATGSLQWYTRVSKQNLTSTDTACILAVEGVIVSATSPFNGSVTDGNEEIVGVDGATGQLLWTIQMEFAVYNFQASAPGDGTVIFMDKVGGLYRARLRTGEIVWQSGIPERKQDWWT